ncbi:uncharacterized protein METZ01_LOCUS316174, partial [marine metagenome]
MLTAYGGGYMIAALSIKHTQFNFAFNSIYSH